MSCNFNLTSTSKGCTGKLPCGLQRYTWPSGLSQQPGAQWFESRRNQCLSLHFLSLICYFPCQFQKVSEQNLMRFKNNEFFY